MAKKTVYVNENSCIGCTLCTQICSKVFEMNENGKSHAANPSGDDDKKIQQAIDSCPVNCIHWKE